MDVGRPDRTPAGSRIEILCLGLLFIPLRRDTCDVYAQYRGMSDRLIAGGPCLSRGGLTNLKVLTIHFYLVQPGISS